MHKNLITSESILKALMGKEDDSTVEEFRELHLYAILYP